MQNFNYINPIRPPNSSLMSNIGTPALSRRIPINPKSNSRNQLLDQKIDRMKKQKNDLLVILKQKEKLEIDTLERIEKERARREKEHLSQINNEIEELKKKLEEKKQLEERILSMYQQQKKDNLNATLTHIEKSKDILNKDLNSNRQKFEQLQKEELEYEKTKRERAIIEEYEKKTREEEFKKKEKERMDLMNKKREENEKKINEIQLKYLKQTSDNLKNDIILKEKQEQILTKEKNKNSIPVDNNNLYHPNDDFDDNIIDKSFELEASNNIKIPTQNQKNRVDKKLVQRQKVESDQKLDKLISELDIIEEENDDKDDEKKTKILLLRRLMGDLVLPYREKEESSKRDKEKKKEDKERDLKLKKDKLSKIAQLPDLIANNSGLETLLEDDENPILSGVLGKINAVNNVLNLN